MDKAVLDYEKSKEVYEQCEQHIEMKMCYNNIFNAVTEFFEKFRSKEWKVSYGYIKVLDNLYARHCFIVDEYGNVIDPTIFATSNQSDREYYVMSVFDDVEEYMSAIQDNHFMPELRSHFIKKSKQCTEWAYEKGIILIG